MTQPSATKHGVVQTQRARDQKVEEREVRDRQEGGTVVRHSSAAACSGETAKQATWVVAHAAGFHLDERVQRDRQEARAAAGSKRECSFA